MRIGAMFSLLTTCFTQRGVGFLCLGLASALLSAPVLAERADQNKPMNIEADALRYEDGSKTSVFTGNVAVSKGSISMRGQRLQVRQDPAGNQWGELVGGAGKAALFRQRRDGAADEFIEAQAERIVYDSKTATVTLTGKASLRRLKGSAKLDEITGATITYNSNTDVFSVNGGDKQAMGEGASGGRVRVTLTSKAGEAALEGNGKTPAAPSVLKPSLQLKGDAPKAP